MTRSKATPPVHKPAFDEESVLRFAAHDPERAVGAAPGKSGGQAAAPTGQKGVKEPGAERLPVTLMLKAEVIARLKDEANRKDKKIDQVVEKLVTKHLGKH